MEFYSDTTLLFTATDTPYTFKWEHVYLGNYMLTARATDNHELVTTSSEIQISVVRNKPPEVNIIKPSKAQVFIAPATIKIEASAQDVDGRIVQVSFYNGTTLLTSREHKVPYTYEWQGVPAGTYTITARAKDNWSDETTSEPIIVTVLSPASSKRTKERLNDLETLQVAPNPVRNILTITIRGLLNNAETISIMSLSGILIKTMQRTNSDQTIRLDVSSFASGLYYLKMVSGDRILYRHFVKL